MRKIWGSLNWRKDNLYNQELNKLFQANIKNMENLHSLYTSKPGRPSHFNKTDFI